MNFQLEYFLTKSEWREAAQVRRRHGTRSMKKLQGRTLVMWITSYTLWTVYAYFQSGSPAGFWLMVGAPLGLFTVLWAAFTYLQKNANSAENPLQLSLEAEGIQVKERESVCKYLWSGFSEMIESPKLFTLIFRMPTTCYLHLPKRAFPDLTSQEWFCSEAGRQHRLNGQKTEIARTENRNPNGVMIKYRLKCQDFYSHLFTSWRMRLFGLGVYVLFMAMSFLQLINSPPNAANSALRACVVLFVGVTGMLIAIAGVMPGYLYLMRRKSLSEREIIVSTDGVHFETNSVKGHEPWSSFQYYLETRRTIFIWHSKRKLWLLLPKREFATAEHLTNCRGLLQANLRPSRWFFK